MLKHQLPGFYSQILPDQILEIDVDEKKATCDNCIMVPKYKADLKCCTFQPFLPNYLVGAILKSNLPGKNVIQKMIRKKQDCLPIGIVAPIEYQVKFIKHRKQFGKHADLLCPYFDRKQKNCGIWKFRGVVCTTFFCQSSYGKKGKSFWNQLSDYLSYVETALLEEALVHMDFSPRQLSDQLAYLNREPGTKLVGIKEIWQDRFDQQEQFYIATFEFVQKLRQAQMMEIGGELGSDLMSKVLNIANGLKLQ